jgi:hypothetical protein
VLDEVGGQRHAPAASPPGKGRYSLFCRTGEPQGKSGGARKISPLPRFDPPTLQPVASRYVDYAIAAQLNCLVKVKKNILFLIS